MLKVVYQQISVEETTTNPLYIRYESHLRLKQQKDEGKDEYKRGACVTPSAFNVVFLKRHWESSGYFPTFIEQDYTVFYVPLVQKNIFFVYPFPVAIKKMTSLLRYPLKQCNMANCRHVWLNNHSHNGYKQYVFIKLNCAHVQFRYVHGKSESYA